MADVTDNVDHHRFEMVVEGQIAFVSYAQEMGHLVLCHTEVPRALSGHGIGSVLARAVLEEVRRRAQRVVPKCEFMAGFIQRHPEFNDLVAYRA